MKLKIYQVDAFTSRIFKGKTDFLFIYASQAKIEEMEPDFGLLTPYWSGVMGRNKLTARQLSARGG